MEPPDLYREALLWEETNIHIQKAITLIFDCASEQRDMLFGRQQAYQSRGEMRVWLGLLRLSISQYQSVSSQCEAALHLLVKEYNKHLASVEGVEHVSGDVWREVERSAPREEVPIPAPLQEAFAFVYEPPYQELLGRMEVAADAPTDTAASQPPASTSQEEVVPFPDPHGLHIEVSPGTCYGRTLSRGGEWSGGEGGCSGVKEKPVQWGKKGACG